MFNGLPIKNKLFDKNVTNEINTAFSQLRQISEQFQVPSLEPKYPISSIQVEGVTGKLKGTTIEPNDEQEYDEKEASVVISNVQAFSVGFESWIQCLISFDDDIRFDSQITIASLSFSTPNTVYIDVLPLEKEYESMKGCIKENKLYIIGIAKKGVKYVVHGHCGRGS